MTTLFRARNNREHGLSMIELLLIIAALGLILGALYQFLLLANRQSRSTTFKQISVDQVNLLLKSISQEVRNALLVNINSEGGDINYFDSQIEEENPQPFLLFTLFIPDPEEESENLEVRYEIVLNKNLWEDKGEKVYMLQKSIYRESSLVKSTVLIDNIYSLEVERTSQKISIEVGVVLGNRIRYFHTSVTVRNPLPA
ncbi:MAG: hypothetical protein PWP60_1153 [Candidatus Atribacteria bacterium]|uniref:Prepilin-type N-terminal cleavage/methylation domain-containing protein n=1 Tax=Thermatribacter velox TaxID=3039681 RepID=A0ABZ2YCU0_9BACT|nr:hypothetical protein [Candidatus Atribacteria bacterium]